MIPVMTLVTLVIPVIPVMDSCYVCYISACLCTLLLTAQFSIHGYDSVLSIHMCLSLLATWPLLHHSPGEFHLTPLDPHVQVMELGAVDSPSCWSEWRSSSVDLQQTIQSSILPGPPLCLSSFPFVNS